MTRKEQYDQLILLVREEADNLRKHARPYEIQRLNYYLLNPSSTTRCIYGQMTGDCYNDRAQELVETCATRVYTTGGKPTIQSTNIENLNGEPKSVQFRGNEYHSPIEVFILFNSYECRLTDNNKSLVAYLKGETDSFEPRRY